MIKTVLNTKINSKIQLLQNRWMCSKAGCCSDHCFVHAEHSEHFPLGHDHFAVWAAAWNKDDSLANMESPPNHRVSKSMSCLHCFSVALRIVTNQLLATQLLWCSTSICLQNYSTCSVQQTYNQPRSAMHLLQCKINTLFSSLALIMASTFLWMVSVLHTILAMQSERGCMKMAIWVRKLERSLLFRNYGRWVSNSERLLQWQQLWNIGASKFGLVIANGCLLSFFVLVSRHHRVSFCIAQQSCNHTPRTVIRV